MPRTIVNPANLYNSVQYGFSHAVESEGARLLHCSGQVGWDENCEIAGPGDLAAQARQALSNLGRVLADRGADFGNIVRIRTYVVDHTPDKLEIVGPVLGEFFGDQPVANTWIGVQALALPDFLIEIEATAVLD